MSTRTLADRLMEFLEKPVKSVKVKEPSQIETLLSTKEVIDAIEIATREEKTVKQITAGLNALLEPRIKPETKKGRTKEASEKHDNFKEYKNKDGVTCYTYDIKPRFKEADIKSVIESLIADELLPTEEEDALLTL